MLVVLALFILVLAHRVYLPCSGRIYIPHSCHLHHPCYWWCHTSPSCTDYHVPYHAIHCHLYLHNAMFVFYQSWVFGAALVTVTVLDNQIARTDLFFEFAKAQKQKMWPQLHNAHQMHMSFQKQTLCHTEYKGESIQESILWGWVDSYH